MRLRFSYVTDGATTEQRFPVGDIMVVDESGLFADDLERGTGNWEPGGRDAVTIMLNNHLPEDSPFAAGYRLLVGKGDASK